MKVKVLERISADQPNLVPLPESSVLSTQQELVLIIQTTHERCPGSSNLFPHCWRLIKVVYFTELQLIYNVVSVSSIQQRLSVTHIHISTFQILFLYRPLQSIEQNSLCYTVGPYYLSILYMVVCICQSQSLNLSLSCLTPWQP